jgi:hypothetical protein
MLIFPTGIQGAIGRLLGTAAPAASTPLSALRRQASARDAKSARDTKEKGTT